MKKFFDSESLLDCLNEVYKSDVKGKIYRLLYEMNKNLKIKVKTPVGTTESVETGPGVTQGSVEAATLSSVNMGKGVEEKFEDSVEELFYVDLKLNPCLFLDDIFRMAGTIKSAQEGNNRLQEMMEEKGLEFHGDKSCFLLMGNKKGRKKLKTE